MSCCARIHFASGHLNAGYKLRKDTTFSHLKMVFGSSPWAKHGSIPQKAPSFPLGIHTLLLHGGGHFGFQELVSVDKTLSSPENLPSSDNFVRLVQPTLLATLRRKVA